MDAIQSFFAKYHAVPVVARRGEADRFAYEVATDDALIGHADADCKAWDAELPAHVRLDVQNRLVAVRDGLWKRMKQFGLGGIDYTMDTKTEAHKRLTRAWHAASMRVGFGPSN